MKGESLFFIRLLTCFRLGLRVNNLYKIQKGVETIPPDPTPRTEAHMPVWPPTCRLGVDIIWLGSSVDMNIMHELYLSRSSFPGFHMFDTIPDLIQQLIDIFQWVEGSPEIRTLLNIS